MDQIPGGVPPNSGTPQGTPSSGQSSLGMAENAAGALCYLFGWITGIIFFLLEKQSSFVKFHAMQSILTFGALSIISIVPIIGWMLSPVMFLVSVVLWVFCLFKAYKGERFKLPIAGNIAEKHSAV